MSKKRKGWLYQKNKQSHFVGEQGTKSWNQREKYEKNHLRTEGQVPLTAKLRSLAFIGWDYKVDRPESFGNEMA